MGQNHFLYVKDPSNSRTKINSKLASHPFERPVELYPAEKRAELLSEWNLQPPPPGFELGS